MAPPSEKIPYGTNDSRTYGAVVPFGREATKDAASMLPSVVKVRFWRTSSSWVPWKDISVTASREERKTFKPAFPAVSLKTRDVVLSSLSVCQTK